MKQRLVGVAVIFSLAVIFLPLLLDGSGRQMEELNVVIPPRPQIDTDVKVEEKVIELERRVEQLRPLQPVIVDEVSEPPSPSSLTQTGENNAGDDQSNDIKPSPAPTKKVNPSTPQTGGDSWVIQVGSFGDRDKAYSLRDKLRKSRLSSVFIERYPHQGQTRYRVRMGPFIEKNKAQVVQNKVLAKYNIKGLVMRYEK